jgi:hypothetical protein
MILRNENNSSYTKFEMWRMCQYHFTKKLNALDDVSEVSVETADNSVTFEYSEAHTLDVVKKVP